jgi:hypothetical protein
MLVAVYRVNLDTREFFFSQKKYNTFVVETQVNEAKNIH